MSLDIQGKTGFGDILDFVVFSEKRYKLVYGNERNLSVISSDRTKLVLGNAGFYRNLVVTWGP